jgi:hypothetical protein
VVRWCGSRYQQAVVAPRRAWVEGLDEGHAAVVALARVGRGVSAADGLAAGPACRALGDGDDAEAARAALDPLQELRADLERAYELRIVVGDDVTSGVWRVPDANERRATTT